MYRDGLMGYPVHGGDKLGQNVLKCPLDSDDDNK